jgi:small GTP-binding protein
VCRCGRWRSGQNSLLISYSSNKFPAEYIPAVFDDWEAEIVIQEQQVKISLWDTVGQQQYARIRALSYPKTDIFLLCFNVMNEASFANVGDWKAELESECPSGCLCSLLKEQLCMPIVIIHFLIFL